jgi:hypothetical protein
MFEVFERSFERLSENIELEEEFFFPSQTEIAAFERAYADVGTSIFEISRILRRTKILPLFLFLRLCRF